MQAETNKHQLLCTLWFHSETSKSTCETYKSLGFSNSSNNAERLSMAFDVKLERGLVVKAWIFFESSSVQF